MRKMPRGRNPTVREGAQKNSSPPPTRERQNLFPFRKVTFARPNMQLRLCRRAHANSPEARAAGFVIGIVLKQILRSNLRRDPLENPVQLAFISRHECSATSSCRDALHAFFRSSRA